MVMSASTFLAQFRQIKAYLDSHPDASLELRASFAGDNAAFKLAYTPDAIKQALSDNAPVDSDLEDRITSTVILLNRDRARRGSSG